MVVETPAAEGRTRTSTSRLYDTLRAAGITPCNGDAHRVADDLVGAYHAQQLDDERRKLIRLNKVDNELAVIGFSILRAYQHPTCTFTVYGGMGTLTFVGSRPLDDDFARLMGHTDELFTGFQGEDLLLTETFNGRPPASYSIVCMAVLGRVPRFEQVRSCGASIMLVYDHPLPLR